MLPTVRFHPSSSESSESELSSSSSSFTAAALLSAVSSDDDGVLDLETCAEVCDETVGCWGFNANPSRAECYFVGVCAAEDMVTSTSSVVFYNKDDATTAVKLLNR